MIPDTQSKHGVPLDHLSWIGQYIVDRKPEVIVHLGDHWDMPSLSSYDKGTRAFEGRRYQEDIKAGNEAFAVLNDALASEHSRQRRNKEKLYLPEKHFLVGNHEERIARATNDTPELDGAIGYHDFNAEALGWQVHDYLDPVLVDGVAYSHYWYNPGNGRAYNGMIETRLKNIGFTFTQGHKQGLLYGLRQVGDRLHHGLVAGSCYLHDEDYLGPQATTYWRGIIVKHQVCDGSYDPMFVSLDYLARRYTGKPVDRFMR